MKSTGAGAGKPSFGDLTSGRAFDNGCVCFYTCQGVVNDLRGKRTECTCSVSVFVLFVKLCFIFFPDFILTPCLKILSKIFFCGCRHKRHRNKLILIILDSVTVLFFLIFSTGR